MALADEFRQQRIITNEGTDVLQLLTTLAYAWDSLSQIKDRVFGELLGQPAKPNTSVIRKHKNQKARTKRKLAMASGTFHRCAPSTPSKEHQYQCPVHGKWFSRGGFLDHL